MTLSISMICQLNLSKMLIGIELHMCIHKGECAYVCERMRLYCVSKKKEIYALDRPRRLGL